MVSNRSQVCYGVPQDSVLGPLLFMLYMLLLGNIIRKHRVSFHCSTNNAHAFVKLHFYYLKNISKLRPMLLMSNSENVNSCVFDLKDRLL